jgi:hypothetical protein
MNVTHSTYAPQNRRAVRTRAAAIGGILLLSVIVKAETFADVDEGSWGAD